MVATLSIHEALIWVMVTTSAADRTINDRELSELDGLIARLPVFDGYAGDTARIAEACTAQMGDSDGLDTILDIVADALPERLYETAYALAVEVAAADVDVRQEELVFLQMIEDRFGLGKLTVAAIEHSARVRYRRGR